MAPDARWPFAGIEAIELNHSQAWQDIFTLTVLGGLRDGSYLEIGGNGPIFTNNTYLLYKHFGWQGTTVELDHGHAPSWVSERPDNQFIAADALLINYPEALREWFDNDRKRIDYLQLDIDPAINTLNVLKRLPLDEWRFSVITFETDIYAGDSQARDESRSILSAHGYELVAKDVGVLYEPVSPSLIPFEDWWVDPAVVRPDMVAKLKSLNQETAWPQDLLFVK